MSFLNAVPGRSARGKAAAVSVLILAMTGALLPALSSIRASADQPPTSNLVAATPATNTPNVVPGSSSAGTYEVNAMTQVGGQIIMGGLFKSVLPPGDRNTADGFSVTNIVAFDQATGAITTSFHPVLAGGSIGSSVNALAPGPTPHTVYVGGSFNTVNGTTAKYLALIDTTTGQLVTTFLPKLDGVVTAVTTAGSRLLVGGNFTHAQALGSSVWTPHQGLASMSPTTGALDPYLTVQLAGHHNYTGVAPFTAFAPVGVKFMTVSPDGMKAIVDGNFTSATDANGTSSRDQILMLDLLGSGAQVDPTWATQEFDAACFSQSEDSYIRAVSFSPDGSYFVVAASGGDGTNADGTKGLCDSASRWETSATGPNVQPTWVDWSGRDTLYSVAITTNAVYIGGHERWMNNSKGHDSPGVGSVPRAGVSALDPASGVPFSWNPGRTPRGAGTYSLLATAQGIYAGSDTAFWGPGTGVAPPQQYRGMIAFFPVGGSVVPSYATAALPANVYLASTAANPSKLQQQFFNGSTASAVTTVPDPNALDWSQVRGAFMVGSQLFYGYSDGNFYVRSFDGVTLGKPSLIDPYNDPAWANVDAGSSPGSTDYPYRGKQPTLYGSASTSPAGDMTTITGMLYWNGRLYYTQAGKPSLRYRPFTPESGIAGADKCVSGTTTPGVLPCVATPTGTGFSNVAGMFLSGSTLYFSDQTGNLWSVAWNNGNPDGTSATLVAGPSKGGTSWKSQGMFLLAPGTPTASFTASCTYLSCSVNGSGSTSPGSAITSYAWDFGDGQTGSGATTSHTYGSAGPYTVTLTVTNAAGVSASTTQQVTATAIPPPVASFQPSCSYLSCSFDGSGSTSPGSSITSYAWDFGDGQIGSGATTTHSYASAGPYTVTLTVTNTQNVSSSITGQVNAAAPPAPTATFTPTCAGQSCSFNGAGSTAPGSAITSYAWDFGDGNTATGATATDVYANPGTYTVTLTVTNTQGLTGSSTQQVSVAAAPTASFTATCTLLSCSVDGTGSTAPGSTITGYAWDFGDGGTGSGATTSHPYAGPGTYTITLTVTNAIGGIASSTQQVTVAPAPSPTFTSSCSGLSCSFDGSGSTAPGATITSYAWDFGDSNTGTGATTSHVFAGPGTYSVTLTVTNSLGTSASYSGQITVAPGPAAAFTPTCTALGCTFDGSASTSPGSSITSYAWTFGDGGSATGVTSAHTFAAAGTFTVTLKVTNALGASASTSQQVTVAPAPVPSFTASCAGLTCSVNGSTSTAPGSTITAYAWSFGDGNTGSGVTASNVYSSAGADTITLTVTNAAGTSTSTTQTVNPGPGTAPIAFVGQAATNANATTESVTVPSGVSAGNGLVLIATSAVNTAQTAPAGWSLAGTSSSATMYTSVWQRVATSTDAGSKITVVFGTGTVKGTLQLLAYSGTSAAGPIATATGRAGSTSTTTFSTPGAVVGSSGAWVASYWAARSSTVTTWTAPNAQTVRGSANGTGGGHINSLATDFGGVLPPGSSAGLTASTDVAASSEIAWTLVLAPSP